METGKQHDRARDRQLVRFTWSLVLIMAIPSAVLKWAGLADDLKWWEMGLLLAVIPATVQLAIWVNILTGEDNARRRLNWQRVLARWRKQLETGKCDRCGGRIYQVHREPSDILCCENQYNGELLDIVGTGKCVNIAELNFLNQAAEELGETPLRPV